MSEFIIYRCQKCDHTVPLGFSGKQMVGMICCGCHLHFMAAPQVGEKLWESNQPYQLMKMGKEKYMAFSKKGRVKTQRIRSEWVSVNQKIPIIEEVIEVKNDLRVQYLFDLSHVSCPDCNKTGALVEEMDYVKSCPVCQYSPMSEETI